MTKKELFFKLKEKLDTLYENPHCTLDYTTPFELLVATILSAQCTDARVNIVTKTIFPKYNTPEAFASLSENEISKLIQSTGFYRNKAKNIRNCAITLVNEYNSIVPDTMEELTKLAGVGRKTAGVILGEIYKKPAIVIDTHAKRLANRMGLTKQTDPVKIELELAKFIPPEFQFDFCHRLVAHGRAVCKAQKPACETCILKETCKHGIKTLQKAK
ncbi:MAG: endonuclease III [Clostridia bacterium]|nr:endonuclease III [Clostridia bacterium]